MTSAIVVRADSLINGICRYIEDGRTDEEITERYHGRNLRIQILGHKNARKASGAYQVEPRHFEVTESKECLFDHILRRTHEILKTIDNEEEFNLDYYLIEVDKKNFSTKVLPRSINSALRMLYLDKYEGLIKKSLELKKSNFSSWDSFFLAHVVGSDVETYDHYNGFISGRSWYYQTEKILKSRMLINADSTNMAFSKDHGVNNIDYSIVDKLLVEGDYKELLTYLKECSFGNDPSIGKYLAYNGDESKYVTIGSHYEIIGSKNDSLLVIDNFFNHRHIKKTKFTLDEQE